MDLNSNILILEDEPLVRLMLLAGLETAGCSVDVAETCAEALRMIRSGAFDAAIFDYRLPDGVSTDVLRALRKEGEALPVVLLTAEVASISTQVAAELQLVGVLSKPPCVPEVLNALQVGLQQKVAAPPAITCVGPYLVWNASSGQTHFFDELDPQAHVVIDCSSTGDALACCAEQFLQTAGNRAALCGAAEPLQNRLMSVNPNLICVDSMEQLRASLRRFSLPNERAALLGSVVRNDLGETP